MGNDGKPWWLAKILWTSHVSHSFPLLPAQVTLQLQGNRLAMRAMVSHLVPCHTESAGFVWHCLRVQQCQRPGVSKHSKTIQNHVKHGTQELNQGWSSTKIEEVWTRPVWKHDGKWRKPWWVGKVHQLVLNGFVVGRVQMGSAVPEARGIKT